MGKTTIEWTDETWNPLRGCSRESPGCVYCYAEQVGRRFSGKGQPYEGLIQFTAQGAKWTGVVRPVPGKLGGSTSVEAATRGVRQQHVGPVSPGSVLRIYRGGVRRDGSRAGACVPDPDEARESHA